MPGSHALLSPSGAYRWFPCTPSARLEELFDDTTSEAAAEGTLAHSISELLISRKLGRTIKKKYDKELAEFKLHPLFEPSMYDYCEDYANYVIERYNEALARNSDAKIFLETQFDLTKYIPEGFGTGDVCILADDYLDFIDLKYGKGVPVAAYDNKQLKIYGLGALDVYGLQFDIRIVRMTIYQPRLDNISTFELSASALEEWGVKDLMPRAAMAFDGTGNYAPGEHCRFCRAKVQCVANAEFQLQLDRHEFRKADLLDDSAIADILTRADAFENWIEAVKAWALDQAVQGRLFPGFKLVAGRSNRSYIDEVKVVETLVNLGHAEDDLYNRKIKGIGDMEKELGKTDFNRHLTDLLHKPPGKPTLVAETDPRPTLNRDAQATEDFKDL